MLQPLKFLREVKAEMIKVAWPTVRESGVMVLTVGVVVLISSLFFVFIDFSVYHIIDAFLSFGGF